MIGLYPAQPMLIPLTLFFYISYMNKGYSYIHEKYVVQNSIFCLSKIDNLLPSVTHFLDKKSSSKLILLSDFSLPHYDWPIPSTTNADSSHSIFLHFIHEQGLFLYTQKICSTKLYFLFVQN